MQRRATLMVLLLVLTPTILLADAKIITGYDLYHNIKLMDNPQNSKVMFAAMHATGYLAGYLDGLAFFQDLMFETMFPRDQLTEKEIAKLAKDLKFHRLNIPAEGIATGQFALIYKKYAEKNPEKLDRAARLCVFQALVEAYGWK